MSTRDEDILDFDFFEEEDAPAWEEPEGFEAVPATERGRRGGGGSRFGGPHNLTPLLRLIGLVALAILVVVLLVVWVEGCTADAKRDRNETYLAEIIRVLPLWPRDRYLELAPKYWAATRSRLDPAELAHELGPLTVPLPLSAEQQPPPS